MKLALYGFALALWVLPAQAQETQTDPAPIIPPPAVVQPPPPPPQQRAAPVIRRPIPHPNATTPDSVEDGPSLTPVPAPASPAHSAQPETPVGTIRVDTRLINVTLNVVDQHGMPIGGFERGDFRILEDGKPRDIAVFERESSSPLSIVLAIDASETVLTSERLEREAAKRFVHAILRPQDELALLDFSDDVREVVPFTNQPKQVEQGLSQIQRGDATALFDAVYLASDRLASTKGEPNRRRVLVVISDGGDTKKHTRYNEAVEEAQRAGAMIFSIIVVPVAADAGRNTGGEHTLIQMSEDTGGKYYYVVDPSDLEPAFRHVSDDLRTQYLLGYYAPRHIFGDNGFRRITVEFTDSPNAAKYGLRYRTGYYSDAK